MTTAFLSYATRDHHFAELARTTLGDHGIELWHDRQSIRAGEEWRREIDQGLADGDVILVVLSQSSATSPFVTYEWSYGLGKGKPIIPLKIEECEVHPRLQVVQHLDFSIPGSYPWGVLVESINEIEVDESTVVPDVEGADDDIQAILTYLNQRGYQRMSYERIRERVNERLTDEILDEMVERNGAVFRHATIKGAKRGLVKVLP